jgi:hypothetical protein
MTRSVAAGLAVLLAACQAGAGDDYPPRPGGDGPVAVGPGGSTGGDAGTGDAGVGTGDAGVSDAGVQVSGRVCVLGDLRQLTRCNATGAGGLKVALGTGSGTTNADGTFAFPAQLGFTWHVTGAAIIPSVTFGTDSTIPVLTEAAYTDLLEGNGELVPDEDHGAIVIRVVRGGSSVAGVKAALSPLADSDTRYDPDNNPTVWSTASTGGNGVVWVPGVRLPGPVAVTLSTTDGRTATTTVPVERQAITFVTQSVP